MDLYRFYAEDDSLLYVGISLHAAQRASDHRGTKQWWPEVRRMEVEHLNGASRAVAEVRERAAIVAERPRYNVTHNRQPAPVPTGKCHRSPVEIGAVYAFGLADHSCPVGLVTEVCLPDTAYPWIGVVIARYNWFTGYFGDEMGVEWWGVQRWIKAEVLSVDRGVATYNMDPLATFQSKWVAN